MRVKVHCVELSPYNNKTGVIVGQRVNVDKTGNTSIIFLVRLDRPHRPGFETIGLPLDALEMI